MFFFKNKSGLEIKDIRKYTLVSSRLRLWWCNCTPLCCRGTDIRWALSAHRRCHRVQMHRLPTWRSQRLPWEVRCRSNRPSTRTWSPQARRSSWSRLRGMHTRPQARTDRAWHSSRPPCCTRFGIEWTLDCGFKIKFIYLRNEMIFFFYKLT